MIKAAIARVRAWFAPLPSHDGPWRSFPPDVPVPQEELAPEKFEPRSDRLSSIALPLPSKLKAPNKRRRKT